MRQQTCQVLCICARNFWNMYPEVQEYVLSTPFMYLWWQKVSRHRHKPCLVIHASTICVFFLLMSVEFTPSKRGRVLQLHELNYSYREIEKITGVSKTTAQETVKRNENHHTWESLPRSGCPKAVNDCECHHILQQIRQHWFEPYKAIAKHVGSVTEHQVRTVANDAGYHCCVTVQKPFLTAAAVKKHIAWAKENQSRN